MKALTNILALSFLLFVCNNAFSQKTLDKVVNETCDCMKKTPVKDNINGDEFKEMIGTCLTTPLGDNYEKLCKERKI